MPTYLWTGKNRQNMTQKGEIEANNEEAVKIQLLRLRITPTKIKPKPKDIFEDLGILQPKVKNKDIILFSRQFSTMIDAGLPIVQCLDILQSQEPNKTFKKVLRQVKESVENGATLAEAMREFPKQFDDLYCNMVAAGEAGGILDVILRRLSAYLEKNAKLKAKIKGAMTYPCITLAIAIGVLAVIMIFVIPVFEEMFADMDSELPGFTQIVVDASRWTKSNLLWILIGVVIFVIVFVRVYKTPVGRYRIDGGMLKAPVFGMLLRKAAVARFTRTMGTMMASGVSILDSLDMVAKTSGNAVLERALMNVKKDIAEGRTMIEPLMEAGVFPSMVCQMIGVGESTGALDEMLSKIADFYDEEVDQAVENMTAMIEPLMIVVLGVLLGGVIIAMYLPIFTMAGNL